MFRSTPKLPEIRHIASHPEVKAAQARLRSLETQLQELEDDRKNPKSSSPLRRPGYYAKEWERLRVEINTSARPELSEALHRAQEEYFAPARRRLAGLLKEVEGHRAEFERIADEASQLRRELRDAGLTDDTSALAGQIHRLVNLPGLLR